MKSETEESKSDNGKDQPAVVHHYFVDEAGDPSLFNAKGKVIVGTEGCSRYFTLGKLDIAEPERLAIALDELRMNLLKDPYFEGVPSMQAAAMAPHHRGGRRPGDAGPIFEDCFALCVG